MLIHILEGGVTVGSGYKNCVMRGCEESFSQRKAIQIGWMDMDESEKPGIFTRKRECRESFHLLM